MSLDPHNPSGLSPVGSAQRQAVWPWLLLPLVALALFFALRSVKQPPHAGHVATPAVESVPSEAVESP